jgi:hypothetical protein
MYLFYKELGQSKIIKEETEEEKGPEEGGGDEAGSTVQEKNKQVEQLPNVINSTLSSFPLYFEVFS